MALINLARYNYSLLYIHLVSVSRRRAASNPWITTTMTSDWHSSTRRPKPNYLLHRSRRWMLKLIIWQKWWKCEPTKSSVGEVIYASRTIPTENGRKNGSWVHVINTYSTWIEFFINYLIYRWNINPFFFYFFSSNFSMVVRRHECWNFSDIIWPSPCKIVAYRCWNILFQAGNHDSVTQLFFYPSVKKYL